MKISKLIIYLFILSLSGCAITPKKRAPLPAQPVAKEKFQKIQSNKKGYRSKLKKLKHLNDIIKNNPGTDIADDANLLAGKIEYKAKNYNSAFNYFMNIVNSDVYSPLEAQALNMAANSLLSLGRFDEALALTERGLKYKNLPNSEKVELYKVRYSLLNQLGDRLEAFETLVFLNQLDKANSNSYLLKIQDFIDSRFNQKELESIVGKSRLGSIRGYAHYRLGLQYFEERDFGSAKGHLEDVVSYLPESSLAENASELLTQINARRRVSSNVIGVVLPLSGRHKTIAQKTLRGLQLGLGVFGKSRSNLKLAVIDSEGNPDSARRAVERLVTEDHVIAIVGSLLSRTSVAVASKANELGVPSIALSQKSGITDIGDYVFRNALTSEMQISELVDFAMKTRGFKKFAILYPNDRYGAEYASLFWDHVRARGGNIVGAQTYNSKETNFSDAIERLVGTFYLEGRESEYKLLVKDWLQKQKRLSSRISPPSDLLPPIVDFDALFIPDSTKALGQIAPMLAYHEIQGMTLLGTNLWNSPSLIKRGQKFVDGALFVDGLLDTDKRFKTSSFYREYQRTFKEKPGVFEAQGYDAGLLLRQILVSGASKRSDVKAQLEQISNFPGATGSLSLNSKRELTRPIFRMGVVEGKITKNPVFKEEKKEL